MPKKDSEYVVSETGNWNVAAEYSKLKIMKHLYLADEYSTIATFGHSSFLEELTVDHPVEYLRIKGFRRLLHSLITVIDNSIFAIKKKPDKEKLKKYREALKKIEKLLPSTYHEAKNNIRKTATLKIDEGKFELILEKVLQIKTAINDPLNKSHLIFTDKEEFDPIAFKEMMKQRMINRG